MSLEKLNLELLDTLMKRLQSATVGDPDWIVEKNVFEYSEESIEVAVILKIVRAVHGVHAMNILCKSGLFVDMCAIWRCVNDCCNEVYFLLENYPDQSNNVKKFVGEFFSRTIDNHLTSEEEPVPNKKILSAYARVLSGKEQDENVMQTIQRIYKTNSGYIHASYAHIMEMFSGPSLSFNLSGIPSQHQISMRLEVVEAAQISVVQAIAFVSQTLGLWDLYKDAKNGC